MARPGFNAEKTEAMVYVAYFCGSTCGKGRLYLLMKTGARGRSPWISANGSRER